MAPLKVVVVGGGLAGCLLANGLHNNGVSVTVYERDPADLKREGYQIRLGESAMTGFQACLSEEHIARIVEKFGQSAGATSTAPSLYNSRFQQVLDLTSLPSYSRSWAINRVVLRNILASPLEEAGLLQYGKKFTHYEICDQGQEGEKVRVHFADGSIEECDILVGADGSGSMVNREIGLNNIVTLDTHLAFLGKGSVPLSRLHALPSQLQKGPIMTFSKRASFYYALYLPAAKANQPGGSNELEYDVDEASFYWGINVSKSECNVQSAADIPEQDRLQFCLDAVKDWAPEYRQLIRSGVESESANIYIAPMRASTKPPASWREEWHRKGESTKGHTRVWLLGDAVHAMQANRGMGGNQAFHDCADLLPELLALRDAAERNALSNDSVQEACFRYESTMMDRAFTWVKKSGGTSAVTLDVDGYAGTAIYLVGKLVVPLLVGADWVMRQFKGSK
ncbi:hypothetical protein BDV18DRAFT_3697 [Aspergillus unguis]